MSMASLTLPSSSHGRRYTWDVAQLSTKYPWLRVDAETIEEFRSPFQWARDDDDDDVISTSTSEHEEISPNIRKNAKGNRSHDRYSLGGPSNRRHRSPRPRRRRDTKRRSTETLVPREGSKRVTMSPTRTRSETDDNDRVTVVSAPPMVLPTSVSTNFQVLKATQRQRQGKKTTKSKAHNVLALRFPVLTKRVTSASPSLDQQLAHLHHQERTLQRQLLDQIEHDKAQLPLTFLFERKIDQTYCKQQSIATITSIFAKLQHRFLYHAFQRWITVQDAERAIERRAAAVKHAQTTAVALFERLASDAYVGTLARALQRWATTTKALVYAEQTTAATKIQNRFRQRRAHALLQDLKQASLDRAYKRSMEIDRLLKFERYGTAMQWQTLKNGFNLLRLAMAAKRITFFFRRVRTQQRIARRIQRTQAAIRIQCCWRCKCARRTRHRRLVAREIQRERERVASTHVQRQARGYLARQHAAVRRMQVAKELAATRVLQHAWRRYRDLQRLKQLFIRRRHMLDEEFARIQTLERIEAAQRDEARRNAAAVHLQRLVRGFLGRCEAKRRQDARAFEAAVRFVQHSWHKRQGRYALYVRFLAQRERLAQRRLASALLLQCRFRIFRAKRQRDALRLERQRRRQSAITIQRLTRGHQTRCELAKTRRATVAIQSVWRGHQGRRERQRRQEEKAWEEQQRVAATLKLQCVARGFHARRLTRQLRVEHQRLEQLLQQSAVLIQKRARGIEGRRVAMLLREAMAVVDRQQQRAYAYSTQHSVTESPLLAFVTQHSVVTIDGYDPEKLQWIRWQIDAAKQQMHREDQAIIVLQRRYRGYITRMYVAVVKVQQREHQALEWRMTRKLQRVGRGFLARRRVRILRAKRRGEELKEAYVRERRWKEKERAWHEQYREEQLALQLARLQTLENNRRDAKREAEIAKYQAEAAAARKRELEDQLTATQLEKTLRDQVAEETNGMWAYVVDANGQWYYYNASTGESAWEKPVVEKKSNVEKTPQENNHKGMDNLQKKETVADAKPTAEPPPVDKKPVPEGYCCKCRVVEADKECLDCLLPDLTQDALYCSTCFTLEHTQVSAGKGCHDFKVLRPVQRPSLCQHCPCETAKTTMDKPTTRASYYCSVCPKETRFSCEACFPIHHETAQTSHHIPTALHFRAGAWLCVECQSVLATRTCTQCDEAFCASCFETLHTQSKKAHEFMPVDILKDDLASATDAYCVDCEIRKCTKLCNLCGDGFCDACFATAHAKGQKMQHTSISWANFATHGDWLEILDETTGKTLYFNIETKESTHAQPFVLKSGEERHRVLFQEREANMKKKTLELESEIVKLREEVQAVAQAKDQEIERLKRRRRGVDDVESVVATPQDKPKKKGMLKRLFGSKKESSLPLRDKSLTPEEQKHLALKEGIEADLPLISEKLTTRERAAKEEKAKRTIGTKHFEQAMLDEFVKGKPG